MSRIFPTQFGAPLTQPGDVDADDPFLVTQDGFIRPANPSSFKSLMLPDGVVDAASQVALPAVVLASFDSTASITNNNGTITTNTGTGTETRTEGTGCLRWTPSTNNGTTPTSVFFTFASPAAIGARSVVALDVAFQVGGAGSPARPDLFRVTVTDGAALGGNKQTAIIPVVPVETWQTIFVSLAGLSSIKCLGIERISPVTDSWTSGGTMVFWLDNGGFRVDSKLDVALAASGTVGVIVGAYDTTGQRVPAVDDDTNVLDFGQSSYSNFNGIIYLDQFYVDHTGTTDVSTRMSQIINSAPPNSTIKARAGGQYRFDRKLTIANLDRVTLDFTDAIMFYYGTTKTLETFAEIVDSDTVTVIGGLWLGWGLRPYLANAMVTVAGTPTNSGNNKILDALNEEVRESTVAYWLTAPHYARHLPQQLGLPPDDLPPRNWFQYTLQDTAQVTDDCVISIYDDSADSPLYGTLLQQTSLTLTATPTQYTISYIPTAMRQRLKVTIKKATATANTITISAVNPWGKSEYNATYDGSSGFRVARATNTTFEDMWIEGFAGDALQVSDDLIHGCTAKRVTSWGCSRQGMSFNAGDTFILEDIDIYATGRSGIDFEPYVVTDHAIHVRAKRIRMFDIVNYGLAMGNFARVIDFEIDGVDFYRNRLGCLYGGARDANFRGLRNWTDMGAEDFSLFGLNCVFENIQSANKIKTYVQTNTYDDGLGGGAVTYTPDGNVLRNTYFIGDLYQNRLNIDVGYIVDGSTMNQGTQTNFTNTGATAPFGPAVVGSGVYSNIALGEYNRQLPLTYKGPVASSPIWHPDGRDHFTDPDYNLRSLSGSSTKGNNLRAINVAMAASASSLVVAFPTRSPGTFSSAIQLFSWTTTGSLTGSTTYYYRAAPRTRFAGPGTYGAQLAVTTAAGQTSVLVKLRTLILTPNTATGRMIEGATILRGVVNGGPYTARFDVIPFGLAGMIPAATDFVDIGSALTGGGVGYDPSRNVQAGSWTGAVDESGWEPDASYGVWVETNWDSGFPYITAKAVSGFTITFPYQAPADGSGRVSWLVVR